MSSPLKVIVGSSITGAGKRSDALLQMMGRIRSMVLVEIKTHRTALLASQEYRSGCWAPSSELVGAVAQAHGTVHRTVDHIGERISGVAVGRSRALLTGRYGRRPGPQQADVYRDLYRFSTGPEFESPFAHHQPLDFLAVSGGYRPKVREVGGVACSSSAPVPRRLYSLASTSDVTLSARRT